MMTCTTVCRNPRWKHYILLMQFNVLCKHLTPRWEDDILLIQFTDCMNEIPYGSNLKLIPMAETRQMVYLNNVIPAG